MQDPYNPRQPMGGGPTQRPRNDYEVAQSLVRMIFPYEAGCLFWLLGMAVLFIDYLATSLELFVRFSFGARYLGPWRLILSQSAMGLVFLYLANEPVLTLPYGLGMGLTVLSSLLWVMHRLGMILRERRRPPIYVNSMYFGRVRLIGPLLRDSWLVYRVLEPLLVSGVGYYVFLHYQPALGMWIMVASASLFIKNNLVFHQMDERIREMRDARIVAQGLSEAAFPEQRARQRQGGRPQQRPARFSVRSLATHRRDESAGSIADTVADVLKPLGWDEEPD